MTMFTQNVCGCRSCPWREPGYTVDKCWHPSTKAFKTALVPECIPIDGDYEVPPDWCPLRQDATIVQLGWDTRREKAEPWRNVRVDGPDQIPEHASVGYHTEGDWLELQAEVEKLKAEVAVMGGAWCAQNRAEGRDGCGACAWCCQQQKERAEKAEASLTRIKSFLSGHDD